MRIEKKTVYTRPNKPCWIKITPEASSMSETGIRVGGVYPVAQVRWDKERGATPIKIKSPTTNKLVGLFDHEFCYCDEFGEVLS